MSVQFSADYPTLTIELGVASGVSSSEWDSAVWDTALWSVDTVWHDITAYVRSLRTKIGRSRVTERYVGSGSLTLSNRDGRFSPISARQILTETGDVILAEDGEPLTTEPGVYALDDDTTAIVPGVPIRVKAVWNSVTYPMFYAYVEDWLEEFPAQGKDAVMHVPFTDGWSLLAAFDGYEQASQGAGESAGRRMHRILNNLGWATGTDIENGVVTVQATTLAANASAEALLTADSEGGATWVERDGSFVFEDRYALVENTRSNTTQVTFGTGGVPFTDPVPVYSRDLIRNDIAYARAGSTAQTDSNESSVGRFGRRRHSRTDLVCETDAQVAALVGLDLARFQFPEYRIGQITVFPSDNPSTAWPHVLGRRIRDRAAIAATVPVNGVDLSCSAFIEGVEHEISPMRWVTRFQFSSTTAFDQFALWDLAVWDTAVWFH